MSIRRTVRRLAVVSAAAIALVPATAGVASAQSADDLCDLREDAPEQMEPLLQALEPITGPACDGDGGDGGDGEGPTGTPLDEVLANLDPSQLEDLLGQLPTDELCGLQDEAPEEFAPLLDALAPVIDAICEPAPDPEPEPEPEPETQTETDTETETETTVQSEATTTGAPASDPGTLPNTGGGAALAGLAMLGGALGLRRFTGAS